MKDLRLVFEEKVLKWEQIDTKKMFGCPCYQDNGKLFAFVVTEGIVLTQLGEENKRLFLNCSQRLLLKLAKKPFKIGQGCLSIAKKTWIKLCLL